MDDWIFQISQLLRLPNSITAKPAGRPNHLLYVKKQFFKLNCFSYSINLRVNFHIYMNSRYSRITYICTSHWVNKTLFLGKYRLSIVKFNHFSKIFQTLLANTKVAEFPNYKPYEGSDHLFFAENH